MEELFLGWLREYGYIVLFFWSILEGESGLIMAGIMSHTGDMNLYLSIFIAGLGGFAGDQIYFYIGRLNKKWIQKKIHSQQMKFALAHLLLQKYGWPIIFFQRYMYGMRTITPMAIGLTKYSARKFAIINFISAMMWASLTIVPAYFFGEYLLEAIKYVKHHWYFALPLLVAVLYAVIYSFRKFEQKIITKRLAKRGDIVCLGQEIGEK